MDAAEISRRLSKRALEVCRFLLPNGKQLGREYQVGSTSGESGSSLRIHVGDDDKAGVWSDFAGEKGGDLITLWCRVRGTDFVTALREIKQHFGWHDPVEDKVTKKKQDYRKPTWKELAAKQVKGCTPKVDPEEPPLPPPPAEKLSPVVRYLTEKRKISWEILSLFRIAEKPPGQRGPKDSRIDHGWTICFPYFHGMKPDEPPFNVKYVELNRRPAGGKIEWQEFNAEPGLFGWQAISPNDSYIVLTEGEVDAMTWVQWGVPALSIPIGAGGGDKQLKWIEQEFDRLQRFVRIYICFDRDRRPETEDPVEIEKWEKKVKEVNEAVSLIASRLGYHRCLRVELPADYKDPNEGLQRGMTAEQAKACLRSAKWMDPDLLKPAESFFDGVKSRFKRHREMNGHDGEPQEGGRTIGYRPHWAQAVKRRLVIERGKVLLVHGLSHHGKSEFVRFTELQAMNQGFKIAKASLEEPADEQLWKQCQMVAGQDDVDDTYLDEIRDWVAGRMWIYNLVGNANLSSILEIYSYAVRRHGVDFCVIDSMSLLNLEVHGTWKDDKNEAQAELIRRLVTFARSHGVIVLLVCHDTDPDKDPDGVELPPKKSDIRGVKTIGDLVHDIWCVYRDERRYLYVGRKRADNPTHGRTLLMVQKNKMFGDCPVVPFTFVPECRQFLLSGEEVRPFIAPSRQLGQQRFSFTPAPEDDEPPPPDPPPMQAHESRDEDPGSFTRSSYGRGYSFDPDAVEREEDH